MRTTDERRDQVASLAKGLQVIEAFGDDAPGLSITEVARRTQLTRAAARRYLMTLEALGFVRLEGRLYSLTPQVLRLGQSYLNSARLPRRVQPHLHGIAHALDEAASVALLDGDEIVCVATASSGRRTAALLQPGSRAPAACTSVGRALLTSMAPDALEAWLARQALRPFTTRTIVHPERLRLEILRAQANGFALVDQEFVLGMRSIAVPLTGPGGRTVAAMSVSVAAARMTMDEVVERCLPPLLQAQAQLKTVL